MKASASPRKIGYASSSSQLSDSSCKNSGRKSRAIGATYVTRSCSAGIEIEPRIRFIGGDSREKVKRFTSAASLWE